MLKWVVGLCAVMYLVLVTYGEPTPEELAARELRESQQVARLDTTPIVEPEAVEVAVEEAAPEPAPVAAAVLPTIQAPALVSAATDNTTPAAATPVATAPLAPEIQTIAPAEDTQQASATTNTNEIWRVTARAVNLRSGPSTNNAVVGRATQNDSAEIIEMLPSGWAKVYILETGTEAFVSAQFLAAPE